MGVGEQLIKWTFSECPLWHLLKMDFTFFFFFIISIGETSFLNRISPGRGKFGRDAGQMPRKNTIPSLNNKYFPGDERSALDFFNFSCPFMPCRRSRPSPFPADFSGRVRFFEPVSAPVGKLLIRSMRCKPLEDRTMSQRDHFLFCPLQNFHFPSYTWWIPTARITVRSSPQSRNLNLRGRSVVRSASTTTLEKWLEWA